jgi:hypothetical protein
VVLASNDRVDPDLTNLVELADPAQQYSFTFDGNAQVLDHILISESIAPLFRDFAFARNGADFPESLRNDASRPERLSDHDMPIAYFCLQQTPAVTASLDRIMRVSRNQGTFAVGFTAANNCETELDVLAVIAIPEGAESFRVFDGDEEDGESDEDELADGCSSIVIDFARQRITLTGEDPDDLRALLERLLADGGAAVAAGQNVELTQRIGTGPAASRYRFDYQNGVLVGVKAPRLELEVTASDSLGNSSVATALPAFGR